MVFNVLIINQKSYFNYLLNYSAEMLERNQSLEFERIKKLKNVPFILSYKP